MTDYDINISGSNATITGSSLENALGKANFQVDITDAPNEVLKGDTATVTAITWNDGGVQDTQTIELVVDTVTEDSVSLTLDSGSGSSDDYLWDTTGKSSGDYPASVESDDDSDSATITVLKPLDSLESRYNFEDGAGASTLTDVVGGYDAALNGGVTMGVSSANNELSEAGEFDGSDDSADTNHTHGDGEDFSVSVWVKDHNQDTNVRYITGQWSGSNEWALYRNNGELRWLLGGTVIQDAYSVSTGTKTEWYHAVGVYDHGAGEIRLYRDDTEVANTAHTGGWDANATDTAIGDSPASSAHWDGRIDELRFYNEALSASQVSGLYNNPASYLG